MKKLLMSSVCLAFASLLTVANAETMVDLDALRMAINQQDVSRLIALQPQFDGTDLEMYPRYYALHAQVRWLDEQPIVDFLKRYTPSPLAAQLQQDWLKELARRQQWDSYQRMYSSLTTPTTEQTCYFLKAKLTQGEVSPLLEQRKLWFSAQAQPEICQAVFDAMFVIGVLDEEDFWQRMRLVFAAGRVNFAIQLMSSRFSPVLANQIKEIVQNPQKKLAELDFSTRAGQELAIFAFNQIARLQPEKAAVLLNTSQLTLPKKIAAVAWAQIALIAAKKLSPQALTWYKQSDLSMMTKEERSWMARVAIRQGDWQAVRQVIEAMSETERQLPIWWYWYARALSATDDSYAAKTLFLALSKKDTGYYGLLAREEGGNVLEAMPDAFIPSVGQIDKMKKIAGIRRALKLYEHSQWQSEAVREWNRAMQPLPDEELLAAAALAYQIGWYDRAIYAAEKTQETHNYSMRFPLPSRYNSDIQYFSMQNGVDPAWVYGLIRQESRFASTARSSAGAAGLMQIMPATAQWIATRLGRVDVESRGMNQASINIQFGTYYLKYVANLLSNNMIMATAGYNAGPNRPKQWLANEAIEGAKWIETIPFEETREYVKKVMANSIHYGQQINRRSTLLKQRLGCVPAR